MHTEAGKAALESAPPGQARSFLVSVCSESSTAPGGSKSAVLQWVMLLVGDIWQCLETDVFGCHKWREGVLLASSRVRSETQLNNLQ